MEKTKSRKAVVRKIIVILIVILQPLLACPFVLRLTTARVERPTATPFAFSTATQAPTIGIPVAATNTPAEGPTPQATITTTVESMATGADCMPGTWQIDHDSVVNYISQSMSGRGVNAFTPLSSEGKLELQISSDRIDLSAEGFKVRMGVNAVGITNVSEFDALMEATGNSSYTATDTYVAITNVTYDVEGTMDYALASFTVDFNTLLEIANTLGFAQNLHPVVNTGLASTCQGDVMTIVINPYASVIFRRVEP